MHLVRTKNSYHPYVQVAYYLNCLPEDILSTIPRTTLFDWQHREIHNAFGYDWFKQNEEQFQTLKLVAQNKRLLSFNKGLLKVVAIKRFLETNASAIRAGRLNVKRVVFEAIQKTAFLIGVKPALRYLNLSFQYYSRLKSKLKCATSSFNLCRIKHPSQLLMSEVSVIKKYCQDPRYQFWPISSLYHQMIKDRAVHMNLSTLYKYVALLNLRRNPVPSRRKNHTVGIRAEAPFKILHADLTEFKTEDRQKSYIYLIQDNYSRAILGHIVSQTRKAIHTMQNLIQVKEEYLVPGKIDDCVLMTDDGSENYGEAIKWISESESPRIKHLVAQLDIEYSNSMVEAAHKQLKYRFLYNQKISDYKELLVFIALAIKDFNNRPHHVLGGLSPMEVLSGKRIDKSQESKLALKAKQFRISQNQKTKCCSVG